MGGRIIGKSAIVTFFMIAFGIGVQFTDAHSATKNKPKNFTISKYSILNEDIYDVPVKTQVTLNVLVSDEVSKESLTNLLNDLYLKTQARRGFKYHNSPSHIIIYVYTSKEYAQSGMGQWIAMLKRIGESKKPEISINEHKISQIGARPEEKFGLSENERRKIWNEIIKAEDLASKEAEKKYPLNASAYPLGKFPPQLEFREIMKKHDELNKQLNNKYRREVAKRHKLTDEQLRDISKEGLIKDWPFPKY